MMGSTLIILGGMLLMLSPLVDEGVDQVAQFFGAQDALWRAFRTRDTPSDMAELLARLDDPKVSPIRPASLNP